MENKPNNLDEELLNENTLLEKAQVFTNAFLKSGILNGENKFWMYLFGIFFLLVGYFVFGAVMCLPLMKRAQEMGATAKEIQDNNYLIFDPEYIKIDKMYILLFQFSIFIFAFLGIWIAIRFIHKKSLTSVLTGFAKFRYSKFWFAFAVWGTLLVATVLVNYVSDPESLQLQFNLSRFLILLLLCCVFLPIQTLTEELVFRGYLVQGFSQIFKNGWLPIILTSLLFGLAHMSNPEVQKHGWSLMYPYYAGFALYLSILTLLDEGLELAYGIHLANNLISSLLITSPNAVIKTDAIFFTNNENPAAEIVLWLCMSIASFIIFWLKYRWKNTNLLVK
jgi:uncharacterized protein